MLSMCFQMNLAQRQDLILGLSLESEYFQSFLVRSERKLKRLRYQRAMAFIEDEDMGDYRSVLDFLLAMLSPSWRKHIQEFYRTDKERLGDVVDFEVINEIDLCLSEALEDLLQCHLHLQRQNWAKGRNPVKPGKFLQKTVTRLVRSNITPHIPEAPVHGLQEAA